MREGRYCAPLNRLDLASGVTEKDRSETHSDRALNTVGKKRKATSESGLRGEVLRTHPIIVQSNKTIKLTPYALGKAPFE